MNLLHLIIPIFDLHEGHFIKFLHSHKQNLKPTFFNSIYRKIKKGKPLKTDLPLFKIDITNI